MDSPPALPPPMHVTAYLFDFFSFGFLRYLLGRPGAWLPGGEDSRHLGFLGVSLSSGFHHAQSIYHPRALEEEQALDVLIESSDLIAFDEFKIGRGIVFVSFSFWRVLRFGGGEESDLLRGSRGGGENAPFPVGFLVRAEWLS